MAWRKLGRVYEPREFAPWARSHAANPVAEPLEGGRCRVYFSTRDKDNRSSIAWLEIDLSEPTKVQRLCEAPALSPGRIGAFDDSGVSMGCLVREGSGDIRPFGFVKAALH